MTKLSVSELLPLNYTVIPVSIPDEIRERIKADKLNGVRKHINDLLPEYVDSYRYNTLKRVPESNLMTGKYRTIRDTDFNLFHMTLLESMISLGLPKLSQADSRCVYDYMLHLNRVDPFDEYIRTIKWDGVPRLRRWFIDGLNAKIPSLSQEDSDYVIEEATQAWFMGAVKRNSEDETVRSEVVPVLISKEQGIGKSTYVEYTALRMIENSWYNIPNKDFEDEKKFFESLAGAKVIEWGEATVLKNPEKVEELKSFITKDKDTYRDSYGHISQTHARQWVSIMTTNNKKIFNDTTGNRRFIPMVCSRENRLRDIRPETESMCRYDAEQVWAEAVYLSDIEEKLPVMEDRAVEMVTKCQSQFARGSDFYDAVLEQIDVQMPDIGDKMPVSKVKAIVADIKYLYSEMKNRSIDAQDLVSYTNDEFEVKKEHIYVQDGLNKRRTTTNCLVRIKPSPRCINEFETTSS